MLVLAAVLYILYCKGEKQYSERSGNLMGKVDQEPTISCLSRKTSASEIGVRDKTLHDRSWTPFGCGLKKHPH